MTDLTFIEKRATYFSRLHQLLGYVEVMREQSTYIYNQARAISGDARSVADAGFHLEDKARDITKAADFIAHVADVIDFVGNQVIYTLNDFARDFEHDVSSPHAVTPQPAAPCPDDMPF